MFNRDNPIPGRTSAGRTRCQTTITANEPSASHSACGFQVPQCADRVCTMPKKSAGMLATRRPRKSLICDTMISTAMPLVKPMTTATGMKRISVPSRISPMTNSITPDKAVAMMRLASP